MARKQYNKSYLKACLSKGVRPNGMPYGHYTQFAKSEGTEPMSKADYEEMDEDEADDDGDEEEKTSPATGEPMKGSAKKSEAADDDDDQTVDGDALSKALDAYDAAESAMNVAGASRETYLQARLDAGTISKSERAELGKIWAGEEGADEPMVKSVSDQLSEDENNEALINASDFVKSLVDSVDASLTAVTSEVTRDGHATRELMKAQGGLIKALVKDQMASHEIIKALSARLGMVETQPAARRSVGQHQARDIRARDLSKGMGSRTDGAEGSDRLSKAQVNRGLTQLMLKAEARKDEQAKQQLALATARYETDGNLKPNIEAAIRQEIGALS